MFTKIGSDFNAINVDKITRIGAINQKNEKTKKVSYNLFINFDMSRIILVFKDEKSLDNAYLQLLTDLNNKKIKDKYDFKNLLTYYIDDVEWFSSYFDLLNNDFIALNDNLLSALSKNK